MKRYNGRVDKSLLVTFSVIIVLSISLILLLLWFFGYFRSCNDLKGNLFDEKVLKKYDISWLEKPQNAVNEKQYSDSDSYNYECELKSVEESLSYIEEVFNNFKERNYTVAHSIRAVDNALQDLYYEVAESNNLTDFCEENNISYFYKFFYNSKPLNEIEKNSINHRIEIGSRYLIVKCSKIKNENNSYLLSIILNTEEQKNSNFIVLNN